MLGLYLFFHRKSVIQFNLCAWQTKRLLTEAGKQADRQTHSDNYSKFDCHFYTQLFCLKIDSIALTKWYNDNNSSIIMTNKFIICTQCALTHTHCTRSQCTNNVKMPNITRDRNKLYPRKKHLFSLISSLTSLFHIPPPRHVNTWFGLQNGWRRSLKLQVSYYRARTPQMYLHAKHFDSTKVQIHSHINSIQEHILLN